MSLPLQLKRFSTNRSPNQKPLNFRVASAARAEHDSKQQQESHMPHQIQRQEPECHLAPDRPVRLELGTSACVKEFRRGSRGVGRFEWFKGLEGVVCLAFLLPVLLSHKQGFLPSCAD